MNELLNSEINSKKSNCVDTFCNEVREGIYAVFPYSKVSATLNSDHILLISFRMIYRGTTIGAERRIWYLGPDNIVNDSWICIMDILNSISQEIAKLYRSKGDDCNE